MGRMWTMLVAAVCCLMLAPSAWAQRGPGGDRPGGQRMGPGQGLREAVSRLDLTEEQKKKVDEVLTKLQEDLRAEFEKTGQQRRELFQQLRTAQEAKDEAKVKELQEQLSKLQAGVEEKNKAAREQLKTILTDEQNKKLDELLAQAAARRGMRPQAIVDLAVKNADKLGLSAEQKGKLEDLLKAYGEASKAVMDDKDKPEAEKFRAVRELGEKLLTDAKAVLTAEQQGKLDKLVQEQAGAGQRPGGTPGERMKARMAELSLTEAQNKQVDDVLKAFTEAVGKAETPEARRDLFQKLNKDLRDLLTAEQQKKFDELFSGPRRGAGNQPAQRP